MVKNVRDKVKVLFCFFCVKKSNCLVILILIWFKILRVIFFLRGVLIYCFLIWLVYLGD